MNSVWRVIILKNVDKRIANMPKPERKRLQRAINQLANGPRQEALDTKQLTDRPEWRLRVGQWRVLFLVDNGTITITVISVDSRGDVYK